MPLHKSVVTTPSHLLDLDMFGSGFQMNSFHHLSRNRGEAGWPVVPQIPLLALLEVSGDTHFFFPVLENLPDWLDFSKIIKSVLAMISASSLGTQVHLIKTHGLLYIQFI